MDDAHLLTQYWRERSEAAFAALVRRHLNLVYSAALRRVQGDAHRAEDICQMVFAEVARQAGQLCRRPSLEGWLYTTTRNVAVRQIRAEQRRAARERAAMAIEPEASMPVDADQLRPLIDSVLERLSERDRELVLLRFFRDSAFIDIARRYGITEDAARFRLNRALDRMRSLLAQKGIRSTPALIGAALAQPASAALTDAMVTSVTAGALAHAAATGVGGGAFLLHVMTTTQTAAVAGILLACVGGFWLRRDQTALQSAQSELAAETRAYESAIAQLNTAQAAMRPAFEAAPEASPPTTMTTEPSRGGTLPATKAASSSLAPSAAAPPAAAPPKEEVNWKLSRDPEIRATLSTWIGSTIHAGMAAFYRQTGLPPETAAALDALLLQGNVYMGPNALLTLRPEDKAMEQVYTEMRALLGDATYGQMQQYMRTQFVGAVSTGVAALTYDSAPLTPAQADQLTRLLMNQTSTRTPFPKDINWAEALPQAKTILLPAQYAALESLAATVGKQPAAVNPIMPGTFGDSLNPPRSLYTTPKP